jgi:hypothetical protein
VPFRGKEASEDNLNCLINNKAKDEEEATLEPTKAKKAYKDKD